MPQCHGDVSVSVRLLSVPPFHLLQMRDYFCRFENRFSLFCRSDHFLRILDSAFLFGNKLPPHGDSNIFRALVVTVPEQKGSNESGYGFETVEKRQRSKCQQCQHDA